MSECKIKAFLPLGKKTKTQMMTIEIFANTAANKV